MAINAGVGRASTDREAECMDGKENKIANGEGAAAEAKAQKGQPSSQATGTAGASPIASESAEDTSAKAAYDFAVEIASRDAQIAERDGRIAELEGRLEKAAKLGEQNESLKTEIEQLRMQAASERIDYRDKGMLTVDQQVARLKAKGVTFNLCSEEEAAELLLLGNNYLRLASYRKLYERKAEGPDAGAYVNLDFGDLAVLSSLDRQLRETFLALTVDVEHFAKMKVLFNVEARGEDGYRIVADFYASLNHTDRNAIQGAMRARSQEGERRDAYAGDLIAHHIADIFSPHLPIAQGRRSRSWVRNSATSFRRLGASGLQLQLHGAHATEPVPAAACSACRGSAPMCCWPASFARQLKSLNGPFTSK